VRLTNVVPFLVEDELKRLGAKFEKVPSWQPFQSLMAVSSRAESASRRRAERF